MAWFSIRRQDKKDKAEGAIKDTSIPASERPDKLGGIPPGLPPHMQRIVSQRGSSSIQGNASTEERRAALDRKRLTILYDVEQGELASQPENPWTHRIELLTEALGTVADDLQAAMSSTPSPFFPLPQTPISDITVEQDEGIKVAFNIGGHDFLYAESVDWAERGHQIAQPEFRAMKGDVEALLPRGLPSDLREPLRRHLTDSLAVFATELRNRTLDGDSLPMSATLADLANQCPVCSGWADWRGRCDACTSRKALEQSLRQEQNRLLRERAGESEERHRLSERLPIARRRLADLELEIEAFERSLDANS